MKSIHPLTIADINRICQPDCLMCLLQHIPIVESFQYYSLDPMMTSFCADEGITVSPIRHLSTLVHCEKKNIVATGGGFFNILANGVGLPIDPPVGIFRVTKNEDQAHARGLEAVAGQKGVYIGQPDWSNFKLLSKDGLLETRIQPGKISVAGYISYNFSSILLSAVSRHANLPYNHVGQSFVYTPYVAGTLDGAQHDFEPHAFGGDTTTTVVDELDGIKSPDFLTVKQSRVVYTPGGSKSSQLSMAEMAKAYKSENGVFIEYFRDQTLPDKAIACSVVQRFFFRGLGGDLDVASKNFQRFTAGWNSLQHTQEGMALQHAFFCVQLAESALAGIQFVIHQRKYHGAILFGSFTLVVRSKEVTLEPFGNIKMMIENLDKHSRKLAEIANIIESVKNDNGTTRYPCSISQIDTAKKFVDAFRTLDKSDFPVASLEEIYEKADDLVFDMKYAEVSPKNLELLLHVSRTGDKDAFRDLTPCFAGLLRRIHSNLAYALSFFGPKPPSISYGVVKESQTFTIPKNGTDSDPNLLVQADKKTLLQYIPWEYTPIHNAIAQWDKVLSSGKLIIPNARPGKKEFTNMAKLTGQIAGRDFERFYGLLKAAVIDFAVRDSATGKRKRADEVGDGSRKRRAEKKITEDSMAIDQGEF